MADEDDKVEFSLEDEKEAQKNSEKPQEINVLDDDEPVLIADDDDHAEDDGDDVQATLKKLNKRLKAEKKARKEAEKAAREAQQKAFQAFNEADDSNLHLVSSAIENLRRETQIMTANYADAMSAGDYERAASIQLAMNNNASKLAQLENGYAEMQRQPRRQPPPPEPDTDNALNQIIDNVSPRSAKWLRENRKDLSDERSIRRMFRAHEDAVDEGINPDTDEYFSYIENRLGLNRRREQENPMSSASKPMAKQPAPPAAPVNRGNGNRPNAATLTRAEADMAKTLGMTEREYWQHKTELQKAGRLPN